LIHTPIHRAGGELRPSQFKARCRDLILRLLRKRLFEPGLRRLYDGERRLADLPLQGPDESGAGSRASAGSAALRSAKCSSHSVWDEFSFRVRAGSCRSSKSRETQPEGTASTVRSSCRYSTDGQHPRLDASFSASDSNATICAIVWPAPRRSSARARHGLSPRAWTTPGDELSPADPTGFGTVPFPESPGTRSRVGLRSRVACKPTKFVTASAPMRKRPIFAVTARPGILSFSDFDCQALTKPRRSLPYAAFQRQCDWGRACSNGARFHRRIGD
jgi:hypothetical protein